jgi:hypothetical protein
MPFGACAAVEELVQAASIYEVRKQATQTVQEVAACSEQGRVAAGARPGPKAVAEERLVQVQSFFEVDEKQNIVAKLDQHLKT